MNPTDVSDLLAAAEEFKERIWGLLENCDVDKAQPIKDSYNRFLDELDEMDHASS